MKKDLISRIENAASDLELSKATVLLESEKSKRDNKIQVYTLTLPIVIATVALIGNIATEYFSSADENARFDDQISINTKRDEVLRRDDLDKSVDALITTYLAGGYEKGNGEAILCLHWGSSFLGDRTSGNLQKLVQKDKLCGTDGGGFSEIAVVGPTDPEFVKKELCIASPWLEVEAVARDKAGFHSKPNGRATLKLAAPDGMFLGPFEVVSESYRKLKGSPVHEQLASNSVIKDFEGITRPVEYSAIVECTNDRGTGRTCESRVVVRAKTFPAECAKFFG